VETLLATLVRFAPEDARPDFALCFEGRCGTELRRLGATVHPLAPVRLSRPWTVWRARRRLRALLTSHQYDIVVCHGGWPHWICAPVVRKLRGAQRPKLIFWLHDLAGGTHWVERFASATSPDLVVAGSLSAARTVPRLFKDAPVEVLHPPVPIPAHAKGTRAAVRRELGLSERTRLILMASRLDPLKGHKTLISSLGALTTNSDWQAWIAGGAQRPFEQDYLEELEHQVNEAGLAGRVRFLGHRADVSRLMAAADLLCQPNTRAESFGLSFVEALGAGIPVVTSRIGAAEEIVNEGCGILVPPDDPESLAEALTSLLDDPDRCQALGAAGPARARDLCAPDVTLERLARICQNLVFPPAPPEFRIQGQGRPASLIK